MKKQKGLTLEPLLADCRFDRVSSNVTLKDFPMDELDENTEFEKVHLNKEVGTDQALTEITNRGLEEVTLTDLLFHIRRNPKDLEKYPLVALGSKRKNSDGSWASPYADCWSGERVLLLGWRGGKWRADTRFLTRKARKVT